MPIAGGGGRYIDAMSMVIRAGLPADVPAVAEIWNDGWRDGHLGHVSEGLVAVRTPESFVERAGSAVSDTTVVTVDGVIAGFAMIVADEVEQFYVAGDHRGTKVADTLLAEAERLVAAQDYHAAWLAVVPGNTRARRFYERNDWADRGRFVYCADTLSGKIPVTAHRYTKQLVTEEPTIR
ncbi:L-amino acid N-acyltransferase YncA [Stackebrandtia endophytica]|uniref:L-amino acid N-acyltransferase YncA n=2 Tax=Stackebrandtia endophytica TaxID=1496996 RepID=A0A543ASY9_9ACTN|nr:L-amino acid N-acyltransferase YncA [Stackebrandtia endophytica]